MCHVLEPLGSFARNTIWFRLAASLLSLPLHHGGPACYQPVITHCEPTQSLFQFFPFSLSLSHFFPLFLSLSFFHCFSFFEWMGRPKTRRSKASMGYMYVSIRVNFHACQGVPRNRKCVGNSRHVTLRLHRAWYGLSFVKKRKPSWISILDS